MLFTDKVVDDKKLISLIVKISKNWSKLSRREIKPFCPYIYFKGITEARLVELKKKLQREDIRLWDGYDFLGAEFAVDSIIRRANYENEIKVKIINYIENLNEILEKVTGIKEIYQFYLNEPFYESEYNLCFGIQISKTEDISMMI